MPWYLTPEILMPAVVFGAMVVIAVVRAVRWLGR